MHQKKQVNDNSSLPTNVDNDSDPGNSGDEGLALDLQVGTSASGGPANCVAEDKAAIDLQKVRNDVITKLEALRKKTHTDPN